MLIDAAPSSLSTQTFGKLPRSEVFARRYYGRNLDLVQIENAILMAQIGIMGPMADLFRETLRNDPAVSGMVFKRVSSLSSCDWDIQPASVGVDNQKAKQIADACRVACLRFRDFRQFIYDMGWAPVDGRAASEIEWKIVDGTIRYWPASHTWIHPGRLSFGPQRELRVVERHRQTSLYYQIGLDLNDQPGGKIIQWMPRNFGDYPEREGLAPRLLYWMFFKRFSWRHRMTLTELFGLPWRIIETVGGENLPLPNPEDLDDAEAAAESLGAETTIALAPGMHLNVERPHPESGTLFSMTADEVNDEIAKLVLMQPKTTSGETNRASGVIADKQQEAPLQRDGTGLQEIITDQLLRPFVEYNYGVENLVYTPSFHLRTDPPRDRKADLERAQMVLGMGAPISEAEIYEVAGYRKPKHGEPVIRASQQTSVDAFGKSTTKVVGEEQAEGPGGGIQDAVANLLDAFDADLLNEPDSGEQDALGMARPPLVVHGPTLLARLAPHLRLDAHPIGKVLQPSSANGSPEPLIDKGVREAARAAKAWAEKLSAACDGKTRPTDLHRALDKAAAKLDVEAYARAVERRLVHGMMLGALDAHVEMIGEAPIKPTAFGRAELAAYAGAGVADFTTKPFAEAIQAFARKKVLPRRHFDRLVADAKRRAFTIAGQQSVRALRVAHDELGKAIAEGADLSSFRKALEARFDEAGWTPLNPSHVETVFRTNVMGAYGDGRHAQMTQPAVLAARPYWQILGPNDSRTRPHHKAAHGRVLSADDPFWKSARPPFGYNCRCRVVSRSPDDIDRLGLSVSVGADLLGLPDEDFE